MAIRTLPSEERYSNQNNARGGGTEPRRKLKLRSSVKVANLDRLRLSMRREKTRFTHGSSSSESSSSPMSGTSPNYMRATTSSSARKASSASRGKSSSKLSEVSVEQCSDPAGVNIPVDIKLVKSLKRVPSMKRSNKLSSMKSMKIRAKYSQFQENERASSSLQIPVVEDNVNACDDQDGMMNVEPKQKGALQRSLSRSRSIRLMRLKSVRSSRRPKSRFGGGATIHKTYGAENSNAEEPHMKATNSQETRKYTANGLTRTSTLRPLRILAKIPSLRPRRSKVRKRPEVSPLPGISVDRATCSSVLKSSKFPDHIQVNSGRLESEGFSSIHVCPYNYCSLHGHHHHAPSPPLKDFISTKRQLVNKQKGKQLDNHSMEAAIHSKSAIEDNHSKQAVDAESPPVKEVIHSRTVNDSEAEDSGMEYLIKVYAKPRKKWAIEGAPSPREDSEAIHRSDHTNLNFGGYKWKLDDILGGTSRPQAREEALSECKQGFCESGIESGDKTQQQTIKFADSDLSVKLPDSGLKSSSVDKTFEPFRGTETQSSLKDPTRSLNTDSEGSYGGDLINILSDKQKYSNIWQLIYQQFVSIEESMSGNKENRDIGEREQGGDASRSEEMNDLDLRQSKHTKSPDRDEDNHGAALEKTDFDQTAAIRLVEEALNAILQCDGKSSDQQAIPDQEMPHRTPGEQIFKPAAQSEETFGEYGEVVEEKISIKSEDKLHKMEQVGEALQPEVETNETKMPRQNMSKNLSKLRKMIVTAKFIKAMEKLKKISPGKPRNLLPEPTSEEERVFLRHLSMNERKNEEGWMLDFALRKVISRLAPDQQRRVALLVEAFETVGPENKEGVKCYPEKGETAPGIETTTSMNEEPKQLVESKQGVSMSEQQNPKQQDDGVPVSLKGAIGEINMTEDHPYEAIATGDKILQEEHQTRSFSTDHGYEEPKQLVESKQEVSISEEQIPRKQGDEVPVSLEGAPEEMNMTEDHPYEASSTGGKILQEAHQTRILSDSPRNSSTTSTDRGFEESSMGNEEVMRTLKVPPQFQTDELAIYPAGDMIMVLFDKQKYITMWNMIYQHVVSSEASKEGKQGVNGLDEKDEGGYANTSQRTDDLDSTQSSYSTDLEEDEDSHSVSSKRHELSQSAAIKLVKEAVNAILQRHELSSDQQCIKDHGTATDKFKELTVRTGTHSNEENPEGSKRMDKDLDPEAKILEKTTDATQEQVANESKAPHKKISKSLSRLRKAIVTTKFIKAMERLRKINLQKPRHLFPEAPSEGERVYLRHLSMDGRKNSEEWMLDYALRKVITKLDPDQQRRVALLVEAFETVTPEQKEQGIRYYPLKGEPASVTRLTYSTDTEPRQFTGSEQGRSIFDEQVSQKQDDGFLPAIEAIPEQRNQKDHDHQASTADDKTQEETDPTAVSNTTLESSENSSKSACVDVAREELSTGDEEMTTTVKVSPRSPTGDFDIGTADDMTSILSDKNKYTNMWQLIYQHVVLSEASVAGKHGENEVHEDEQGEDANNGPEMNDLDPTVGSGRSNCNGDENNQTSVRKEPELDQSKAIKLVKEAINAILKCQEQRSNEQSLQEHDIASVPTEENSTGWKRVEKHRSSEPDDKFNEVTNENMLSRKEEEASELTTSQRESPKRFSKLKKLIITAKFMKAMERMRRISPRKPRYLSPEAASEEERVHLRHQDINERRNAEEWMLDCALRKVISDLAPEQRRRVAFLVDAFETVAPEQKGNSTRSYMKAEVTPDIELGSTPRRKHSIESEHDNSTSYDDHICQNAGDISALLSKAIQLETTPIKEDPTAISKFKTKLYEKGHDLDGDNLQVHHQTSSRDCPVGDPLNTLRDQQEIESNSMSEPLQGPSLSKDSTQDCEANITKGIFSDTQKHTNMWYLIYQHAKSVTALEAGCSFSETEASKDDLESGSASSEMTADVDADDSDASSVTSELGESDTVKLVREAINDILAVPQELGDGSLSSNIAAASDGDQIAGGREKTTARAFNKLRRLIICKKFIKTMEKGKTQKSYPQKHKNWWLNSDPEAEKTNLKPFALGKTKSMDELMLDRALQKVIGELAPVQQRRVALLVEAFEKVKPDGEERGKRFSSSGTESLSTAGNAKEEKESIFELSHHLGQLPGGFDLKPQRSVTTSSKEVAIDSALERKHKENTPVMRRGDWRNNSPSASDLNETPSNVCKNPAEVNSSDIPGYHIQQEGISGVDVNYSEPAMETAEKPSQAEDLKDKGNTENDISVDKVRHTSLWRLLVQHVKSDILEEAETQITGEIDANERGHRACELPDRDTNDQYQLSAQVNHDEDMNVQMPRSMSFEYQEKEAIKVVQEALDAILTSDDDQSMTASRTSDRDGCTENHELSKETATEEIEGGEPLMDSVAKPKEEHTSADEKLSNSNSKLSKIILCKRFIKAMDKMRKLKSQSPQDHSEQLQLVGKTVHPMCQTASNQRKNWEEWMLDHAMQEVVGKLAPAQKKRVSLLVQAFEKISSQPETGTGQKARAAGL